MRSLVVGFCCLIVSTNVTSAQDAAALAKSAQAVLKDRCFSCHGESGANEGGFNYALNRKRLVHKLVVPGSIDESELYARASFASVRDQCRMADRPSPRTRSTH